MFQLATKIQSVIYFYCNSGFYILPSTCFIANLVGFLIFFLACVRYQFKFARSDNEGERGENKMEAKYKTGRK